MPLDPDTSADELGQAFAALARAARAIPDSADIWRAIADWRAGERGSDGAGDGDDASDASEALALMLQAHAVVLDSHVQLVRKWQRLMARSAPLIRARLDDYRAEDDPLPEVREALIDQIRLYVGDVGELAMDHGRAVKENLEKLQRELLPRDRSSEWVSPDDRSRAARAVRS